MRFEDLFKVVYSSIDQNDYGTATGLLEEFLAAASGPELAKALDLKAQVLLELDPRNAPAALMLRERALEVAGQDPGTWAYLLVEVLSNARFLGDVDRGIGYEHAALLLLKNHTGHPEVERYRAFLVQNCGRVAQLRGERALALWYFLRAEEAYQSVKTTDAVSWACYRSGNFVNLYEEYMNLNRMSEAREMLSAARQICPEDRPLSWATVAEHEVEWGLASDDLDHATHWLQVLADCQSQVQTPELEARLLILQGLIASQQRDWAHYHRMLDQASSVAVSHRLDTLLAEVQRLQRTPSISAK